MVPPATKDPANQASIPKADRFAPATVQTAEFPSLTRTPLVPETVLKRHGAYCAIDTRFRAAARLQQALWLKNQNIPTLADGRAKSHSFLGTILTPDAARAGKIFLSNEVYRLALQEWLLCEEDAAIDPERLFGNALSSMPLVFNLFGPLALNTKLATAVFRILLPDFVHSVQRILFEHSIGRRKENLLADRTAWDLAIQVTTTDGEPATIFIEVKFSESMEGPAARMRDRYNEASSQVHLYRDPDSAILRSVAIEQLWREHMLAQLAVDQSITSRAIFMAIGPRLNRRVQAAFRVYEAELLDADQREPDRVAFAPLTLETVIEAIAAAGASDLAQALWGRYCDLDQVYRLSMQEFAGDTVEPPSPLSANNSSAGTPALPRTRRRMSSSRRSNSTPTADDKAAAETSVLDAKVEVAAP